MLINLHGNNNDITIMSNQITSIESQMKKPGKHDPKSYSRLEICTNGKGYVFEFSDDSEKAKHLHNKITSYMKTNRIEIDIDLV